MTRKPAADFDATEFEDRKLQYLNASSRAQSADEREALDKKYADIIERMREPEAAAVKPAGTFREPVSLEEVIAAQGAANVVAAALPLLTLDELNATLEALGPLLDAGGAAPSPPPNASGVPADWRKLQWKKMVALANSLRPEGAAEFETADAARAYLESLEAPADGLT